VVCIIHLINDTFDILVEEEEELDPKESPTDFQQVGLKEVCPAVCPMGGTYQSFIFISAAVL